MGCTCFTEDQTGKKENSFNENKKKKRKIKKDLEEEIDDDIEEVMDEDIEKEIEQMNNMNNKEKIKEKLKSLYESYYAAKTYFCSNDFKEKELDAITKLKKIIEFQNFLKEGKYKKINMKEFPDEITPQYITDYSDKERKKKIEEILNRLNLELDDAKNSLNKKLEEIKGRTKFIKKENIENFKQESKKILDIEKNRVEKIKKEIAIINEISKDEYIPIPECIIENEEYQIEKINDDIPKNVMRININNLTYSKSNPLIIINLKFDNIDMKKEIKAKNRNDINDTFDWEINEKDYKNIIRNRITILLERTYLIKKNKIKGSCEISLRNFRDRDLIEGSHRIKMISGKDDNYIDVSIKIREPIYEKQYEISFREVLKIKRVYPKFSVEGDNYMNKNNENNKNDESINKLLEEIEGEGNKTNNNKIESKEVKDNYNNNNKNKKKDNINNNISKNINKINDNYQTNNNIKKNINNNNNEKIDKTLFKEEELNDVDCIDNLNSLKVLKDRLKKLEAQIAKIDGRTPRALLQKKIKIGAKIKNFENAMSQGEFTPQDYLLLMEHQLKHDVLLCKYLKQENQIDKGQIVFTRINLLNEEINELKQYIK